MLHKHTFFAQIRPIKVVQNNGMYYFLGATFLKVFTQNNKN